MLILLLFIVFLSAKSSNVDFIEEKGVVIVGETTYHAAMIEYNHLLYFYHNHKNNDSNVYY